ncbi:hypothetical protein WICPIJ_000644 [Wickerhamomyces pijperi]|uniref:Uncharacterized protein n=1 Tax=Wickerhamomyces pijperi TaxID=599730 RepID=A0A9P8QDD4_WICPI|nr:hypothetical protein WICPIJ_000644 [Wickerhamomyces pijperi]
MESATAPSLAVDLSCYSQPRVSYYNAQLSQYIQIPILEITKDQFNDSNTEDHNIVIKGLSRTRTLPGNKTKKQSIIESNHQLHPLPASDNEQSRTVKRYFSQAIHEKHSNDSGLPNEPFHYLFDYLQVLSHIKKQVLVHFRDSETYKQPPTHVVLAVPSSFTIIQRQTLSSAVKVMDWKLIRLVNNTTALGLHKWFDLREKKKGEQAVKSSIKLSCCVTRERIEFSILGLRDAKISVFASFSCEQFEDDLSLRSKVYRELKRCEEFLTEKQFVLTEVLLMNEVEEFEDVITDELTDIFPDTKISHQQSSAVVHGTCILSRYLTHHLSEPALNVLPSLKLKETTSHKIQIYSSSHNLPLSLPRNSFIPFITHTTHTTNLDNKSYIRVYLYEGEKLSEDNLTGIVTIEGINRLPAGRVTFEVRFVIKTDGVVKVDMVKDLSGKRNLSTGFTWDYEERGRVCDEDLKKLKEKFGVSETKQPESLTITTDSANQIEPQTLNASESTTPTDTIASTELPVSATVLIPSSKSSRITTPVLKNTSSPATVSRTPTLRKATITAGLLNTPRTPRIQLNSPPSAKLYSPLDEIDTPELLRAELCQLLASVSRLTNNKMFQSYIGATEVSTIAMICDHLREQIEDFAAKESAKTSTGGAQEEEEDHSLDKEAEMDILTELRLDFEDLITPVLKRFDNVVFTSSPNTPLISSNKDNDKLFSFEMPEVDIKQLEEAKKRLSYTNRMSFRRSKLFLKDDNDNSLATRRSQVVSIHNGDLDDIIEKFNKLVY